MKLEEQGFSKDRIHKNLSVPKLVEEALKRNEGWLANNGALVIRTGPRTGRSPNDRYFVEEVSTKDKIWWSKINKSTSAEVFDKILKRTISYLKERDVFVFDGYVGGDPNYRMPIRVVDEKASHALFATTLFVRPKVEELSKINPHFTVIDAVDLVLDPSEFGINSGTFVGISFERKIILIVGSGYGGEIKKSIFTVMNYLLPEQNVFPMHCSANVGSEGDTALFFGLSGTGKTTLSADPSRRLIGDDEHGWTDLGIFNFEGGCYAKVIRLSSEAEPQIYNAIRFGSLLENVITDEKTGAIDYDDGSITENTRATYPVEYIPNCIIPGIGAHPKNVIFLTCDAFGVLPPISKLTPEMAMYHFISGYTAKLAGTEVGIDKPEATFSTCFGAPFMPLHPSVYAKFLGDRLKKHNTKCWLVNSGWSGGPYGEGSRMKIRITRALLDAVFAGHLDNVEFVPDPIFNILVPKECPGVPKEVLIPKNTWKNPDAYDSKAMELADSFQDNFKKFADQVDEKVIAAGPKGQI